MKTSMTSLVAMITIGSVGLVAGNAVACHGFGGGFGYNNSVEYTRNVYVEAPVSAPVFAPGHGMIVVMPGDSWFTISSREYGNTSVWSRIAEFNGLPQNLPLTVGMQLRLPVINPDGSLSISNAPAMIAQGFNGGFNGGFQQGQPQGNLPQGFAQGGMPQSQQFGQQGGMPQGGQFGQQGGMPQGQQFGAQGGQPQGGQFGQQGGQPQGNGFAPQGQGFAPQQGQGFAPQQGQMGAQQGNLPQGGQFAPQGQQFAPQGGMPQGQQLSAQGGMPQLPQGSQAAPQGPMNGQPVAPPAGGAAPQAGTDPSQIGDIAARVAQLAGQALAGSPVSNGAPAANGPVAPAPVATENAAPAGRPLPSIVIGSLMSIGGQQLGDNRGMVHLTINGQVRMLEIVEWTANAAKVKIPADLQAGSQAQIEIIRADGTTVTKDQVQLAAGQQVAAAN